MPKPGYTTLIVKEDLRSRLEAIARAEGFRTVSQFLEGLLRVHPDTGGVYPRVNPTAPISSISPGREASETEPIPSPDFKKGGEGTVGSPWRPPPGFEPGLCPSVVTRRFPGSTGMHCLFLASVRYQVPRSVLLYVTAATCSVRFLC